jgi:hypothetical protein
MVGFVWDMCGIVWDNRKTLLLLHITRSREVYLTEPDGRELFLNSAAGAADLSPEYRGQINVPLVLNFVRYLEGRALF